ncbi:MAG: type II and III secretion system protein [Brevinematia bacterium]
MNKFVLIALLLVISCIGYSQYSEPHGELSSPYPPSPSVQPAKKIPKSFFPELAKVLTNKLTINFENVEIKHVLNFLRSQIPIPVVISPQIPPKSLTISAKDTLIYDIILTLLKLSDVYILYDGTTLMFLPYSEYERILRENFTTTKVYDLRFMNFKEVKEMIKPYLSPYGDIFIDAENNMLIVKDVSVNLIAIDSFLKNVGVSPKLIMIKVEIIQIDRNNSLDYGFDITLDNVIKSITSLSFQSSPQNISGTGIFALKFSAEVPESGGIVSGLIKTLSTYGDVKLLSSPRVVCRNGQKAKILIGDKVPYVKSIIQEQAQAGTTTSQIDFIEAGIKLEVEPRITIEGEVAVDVKVGISSYRFVDLTSTLKAPQINTTEGEIKAVVKDGIPLVIGGLEKTTDILKKSGIPFLMDIPIVGEILFANVSKSTTRSTILIVLTPEIVDYSIPRNVEESK